VRQQVGKSTFEKQVKGLADLFLDTPSFNAHTTGVDALWSARPS